MTDSKHTLHNFDLTPEHLSSPSVFSGVRDALSLVVYVCFVDHCLSFRTVFFCPLCCLFSFDIWIMITSSNSSYTFFHVFVTSL